MTHKTKGIILRTIRYGETSVITTVYTELFGVQAYMVKGVRQASKRSATKANYFMPAAMLEMEVYHNELKNLQFIKEWQWSYLYENVFFNVIKNATAQYIIELLQHTLKQPEANPQLFAFVEEIFLQLDKGSEIFTANLPLYFTLHLSAELGFRIRGECKKQTPVLDLTEGIFVSELPEHVHYLTGEHAEITSKINRIKFYHELENFHLNRNERRQLLEAYSEYLTLHIEGFGKLKSLNVLKEVLG